MPDDLPVADGPSRPFRATGPLLVVSNLPLLLPSGAGYEVRADHSGRVTIEKRYTGFGGNG